MNAFVALAFEIEREGRMPVHLGVGGSNDKDPTVTISN